VSATLTPSWRLGTAPWLLGSPGAEQSSSRAHRDEGEWIERSQVMPGGQVVRWEERVLDEETGHVARRFTTPPPERFSASLGTAQIVETGTAPAWTSPRRQATVASSLETFGAVRVTMTPEAWRSLARMPLASGVEVAGALLGERRGDEIIVREAVIADYERSRYHVRLDSEKIDGLVSGDLAWRSAELVGHAHSHVAERGPARPSEADLRSWLSWQRADRPFVGVIITRSDKWNGRLDDWHSWKKPLVSAFVITRDANGEPNCEIATLEAPPDWTL
jgi:proteasome lid subunit RPN8/RPN11